MSEMSNEKALRILWECVDIASKQYPGVASDYLVAYRRIKREIRNKEGEKK